MSDRRNDSIITASLLAVVFLWGGNNAGTKWLVASWPPVWTGCLRFLVGGAILLVILKHTQWLGDHRPLPAGLRRQLWLRGGISLALYTIVFCWALRLTGAAHVALYIGASPIWALLAETRGGLGQSHLRRYAAALLAVSGVVVLFWPELKSTGFHAGGECCGILSSLLWANYNHQSRVLSRHITGVAVAANAMWMSGLLLLPIGVIEIVAAHGLLLDPAHIGTQALCIVFGGVVPYALWNSALGHWQSSRVMLFNNFIPLTTATWAHYVLGEPLTPVFFIAMALVVAGVVLGQMDWAKVFKLPEGF